LGKIGQVHRGISKNKNKAQTSTNHTRGKEDKHDANLQDCVGYSIVVDPDPHHFGNLDPNPDMHPQQIKIRIRIKIKVRS
jgi:hypothetical protein